MSLVKRAVCKALAQHFADNVTGLATKTLGSAAAWEQPKQFPSLAVLPDRFEFEAWQEEELDDSWEDKLLVSVGTFRGNVELRLSHTTDYQRAELEDAVLSQFFATEGLPGCIRVETEPLTVGGVDIGVVETSFTLADEAWRDEFAFTANRYAWLTCEVEYPVLVMRESIYAIGAPGDAHGRGLIIAFTTDLCSTTPEETVEVAERGRIVKIS